MNSCYFLGLLLVICAIKFANSQVLGPYAICDYGNQGCKRSLSGSCHVSYQCLQTSVVDPICGSVYRCRYPSAPTPFPTPTPPPTMELVSLGGKCSYTLNVQPGYEQQCSMASSFANVCNIGLICVPEVNDICGTSSFCRTPPTPSPTKQPTQYVGPGKSCCPPSSTTANDPLCFTPQRCTPPNECIKEFQLFDFKYVCIPPPPTAAPTKSPTPPPTPSPTMFRPGENEICYNCGTGEDYRNGCIDGTFCTPYSWNDCKWYCKPPTMALGELKMVNREILLDNIPDSDSDVYKDIVILNNGFFAVTYPSKSTVYIYNSNKVLVQTLQGGANTLFGYSISFTNWRGALLVIGSPSGGGTSSISTANSGEVNIYEMTGGQAYHKVKLTYSSSNSGCGSHVVMNQENMLVVCNHGNIIPYSYDFSSNRWITRPLIKTSDIQSIRLVTNNIAFIGFTSGKIALVNIFASITTGEYEYPVEAFPHKFVVPTVENSKFGHSIVVNEEYRYVIVGTGTPMYYRYDWDNYITVSNEKIVYLNDTDGTQVEFISQYDKMVFAKSKGMLHVIDDQGPLVYATPHDILGISDGVTLYQLTGVPIWSQHEMVFIWGKKMAFVNTELSLRPTPFPTQSPTATPTPPTLSPTKTPEYIQRNGRACGLTESRVPDAPNPLEGLDVTSDQCEAVCNSFPECRCFDFRSEPRGDDVNGRCTFFSSYDSELNWVAGETHSFVKNTESVLNVKLQLFVIDSEGELVEREDVRSRFGVDISRIDAHTTAGRVGILWNYVPSPFQQPDDLPEGTYQHITIGDNNPFPVHPVTYDGYISLINAKLLMIDYKLNFTTDHRHEGVLYYVSLEINDNEGKNVYYNTHIYRKYGDEEITCDENEEFYSPTHRENKIYCPPGTVFSQFSQNAYGFGCSSIRPRRTTFVNGNEYEINYRNKGFTLSNEIKWPHCRYVVSRKETGHYRYTSSKFVSFNRVETNSIFTLSPALHSIDWEKLSVFDVEDPANSPVTIKLQNFHDVDPLVIQKIELRDQRGKLIRRVDASELRISGADETNTVINDWISCDSVGSIPGMTYNDNCHTFGGEPCCEIKAVYQYRGDKCCSEATSFYTGDYIADCNDKCTYTNCTGFYERREWPNYKCELYNTSIEVVECPEPEVPEPCSHLSNFLERLQCERESQYNGEHTPESDVINGCIIKTQETFQYRPDPVLVSAGNVLGERVTYNCENQDLSARGFNGENTVDMCVEDPEDFVFNYYFPTRDKVISYASIEFDVDAKQVEYVEITVGVWLNKEWDISQLVPSAFTYEMFHYGRKIDDGVFTSKNEKFLRKILLVKNAGDSDKGEVNSILYKTEYLKTYEMFCNEKTSEHWFNSRTVYTILEASGTTIQDLCVDADAAFMTKNPALFNDVFFIFTSNFEQALSVLENNAFLDGTKDSFVAYESGSPDFNFTVDTVKAAVDFLISIDKMFDCSQTTETQRLENLDTEQLALSLVLEYTFPSKYKSWCDNLKYSEDMRYGGKLLNVGRSGAPCISNAMCHDNYVCADYYCVKMNETKTVVCPAATTTIHPLYYGLKPQNSDQHACASAEVYSFEGLGHIKMKDGNPDDPTPYGSVSGKHIQYDQFFTSDTCSGGYQYVDVPLDHFKHRGSFQGCGNYFTSELIDVGVGLQTTERTSEQCSLSEYVGIRDNARSKQGQFDRVVPRKVSEINRDIKYFKNRFDSNYYNTWPASFALQNGNEMGVLADMLDAQCRFPNVDELSYLQSGVNDEYHCAKIDGCVWSDSLRQCVASRLNVEANFCPLVSDEDQCKFIGFCAWNEDEDHCYHPTAQEYEYDPMKNKENICEIIFDAAACGQANCVWDMVQEECMVTWDTAVILHEELRGSGVLGYHESLHEVELPMFKNGTTKKIDGFERWPTCSQRGDLYKGHQYSPGKWTYYPAPSADTFIVGYGRGWTRRTFWRVTVYSPESHWHEEPAEKNIADANMICWHKDLLSDRNVCEGYGFIWNDEKQLCRLGDDFQFPDVESMVTITTPIVIWDTPGLYHVGRTPNKLWSAMVGTRFDDDDYEDVGVLGERSNHIYPYIQLGCYTRKTKAHCELNDPEYQYSWDRERSRYNIEIDPKCLWLPKVEYCIPRSSTTHNIYQSVFKMPSDGSVYNKTINNNPNLNEWTADDMDRSLFFWNSQFKTNYSPLQAKELVEETKVCSVFTVYEECVLSDSCYWDFESWECKPSLCSAIMELIPDHTLSLLTGSLRDEREAVLRANSCGRMAGCKWDSITHICVPDPGVNFPKCTNGYQMINSYMNAFACPDGYHLHGEMCVRKDKLHCPWGTDHHVASFELYDQLKSSYFYDDDDSPANEDKWGSEYYKFPTSRCRSFERNDGHNEDFHHAKSWKKDVSLYPSGDQGTAIKCLKWGADIIDATEHEPHVDGEFSAANRAFCTALDERYGVCDIHFPGKDFVCITLNGRCSLRYMVAESLSIRSIERWMANEVLNPEVESVDDKIMNIFNYVDQRFDSDSEAYFTMFFTEADIQLIPGLKEKVLTGAKLQERFGDFYVPYIWKVFTGYRGFGNNFPEYEPEYEIQSIDVLDLLALRTEMISRLDADINKDMARSAFSETFTDLYYAWRETQMAAVDEMIDSGIQLSLATETSLLRDLFWDMSESWSEIINLAWYATFPDDTSYYNGVEQFLESDVEVYNYSDIGTLAKAYMTDSISEIIFGYVDTLEEYLSTTSDALTAVKDLIDEGELIVTVTRAFLEADTAFFRNSIKDQLTGFFWDTLEDEFDYDVKSTYEFVLSLVDDTSVYKKVRSSVISNWNTVKKLPNKYLPMMKRKKIQKKTSTVFPFLKRKKIVTDHLDLGVQTLWRRMPPKPPNAPKPPKLLSRLPVPSPYKMQQYKPFNFISPDIINEYVDIEFQKRLKPMGSQVWVQNGAGFENIVGSSQHISLQNGASWREEQTKRRLQQAYEEYKFYTETSGKKTAESGALKKYNKNKKREFIKTQMKLKFARQKAIEQIKLKNQLIAINNIRALVEHNLELSKYKAIISSWNNKAKAFQRPIARNVREIQESFTLGISQLKTVVNDVITELNFFKYPSVLSVRNTAYERVTTAIKAFKKTKAGRILTKIGKFLKKVFFVLDYIDMIMTSIEVFNSIKYMMENPRGCTAWDDFLGLPSDPALAVKNIFSPPKFALRFRAIVLQDIDGFEKELRCAERLSWAMFNADGKYGLVDSRYIVPECDRDVNYREIEQQLSDPHKGLNKNCNNDNQCKEHTSIGKCVYNRCVYKAHYIGMKRCKKMDDVNVLTLDENQVFHRKEFVRTDYEVFHLVSPREIPKKYIVEDEMAQGQSILERCGWTRFAEYEFEDQSTKGGKVLYCFNVCTEWIDNVSHNVDTWMLTMPPANISYSSKVNSPCTSSDECDGGICSKDFKCTPPIECETHRHCYGGYYLPNRLPMCQNGFCVDLCHSTCDNIDACVFAADNNCVAPPTPPPTQLSRIVIPAYTKIQPPLIVNLPFPHATPKPAPIPTLSPTVSPTRSPTTASPTKAPTEQGVFAGSACEFNTTVEYTQCRGDDNMVYIRDIDSVFEIVTGGDYSTCISACMHTEECRYVLVEFAIDRSLKCTYFGKIEEEPLDSGLGGVFQPANIVGCFAKHIPCIPTASPTWSPTIPPTEYPTNLPTHNGDTTTPTLSPTVNPTGVPTDAPTIYVECEYSLMTETKLGEYELFSEVFQVDSDRECMSECDKTTECGGFQYESIARKCILFVSVGDVISYSRATIYRKERICPVTPEPTSAPTSKYVPRYVNETSSSYCDYEEFGDRFSFYGGIQLKLLVNVTVQQCLELCDSGTFCTHVRYIDFGDEGNNCMFYGGNVVTSYAPNVFEEITWFRKVDSGCSRPRLSVYETCNYTTFENRDVEGVVINTRTEDECRKTCDGETMCMAFSISANAMEMNCTLSVNSTTVWSDRNITAYVKNDESCFRTRSPTLSPTTQAPTTSRPTRAPTQFPTLSPTTSPTGSPTSAPTQAFLCDYARLPKFEPRIDAQYTFTNIYHDYNKVHTERTCKIDCDRSNKCAAFIFNNQTESCVFYDIVGPITFSPLEPIVLFIKSRACVIPHKYETEGGCTYTERPEQYVRSGWKASGRAKIENAPDVFSCSRLCDRDGTCRSFDFDGEKRICRFYRSVSGWGVNKFFMGYVKNDPFCVLRTATTDPPTTDPTFVLIIDITNSVSYVSIVLITIYIMVCSVTCCFVCFVPEQDDEILYVIVPDSITYTVDF